MSRSIAMAVLFCLILVTGCTSRALQVTARRQVASVAHLRYQEVMDNLAVVVANPDVLPSPAVVADGSVTVADTVTFDAKTALARSAGITPTTLTPAFSRNPQPQWSVSPIADPKGLGAVWVALRYAAGRPPESGSFGDKLLKRFLVDDALRKLPPDWLHAGCRADVPPDALYSAHCGATWVWITPDGLAGLSALTLIVLDIGTVDTTSLNDGIENDTRKAQVKVEVSLKGTGQDKNEVTVAMSKQPAAQYAKRIDRTSDPVSQVAGMWPIGVRLLGPDAFATSFGLPDTIHFWPPNDAGPPWLPPWWPGWPWLSSNIFAPNSSWWESSTWGWVESIKNTVDPPPLSVPPSITGPSKQSQTIQFPR